MPLIAWAEIGFSKVHRGGVSTAKFGAAKEGGIDKFHFFKLSDLDQSVGVVIPSVTTDSALHY